MVSFDSSKGHIEVEAGIQWPALILYKQVIRSPGQSAKSRREDRVCLGGSLTATNIHGRFPPIIDDVESFVLIGSQCWGYNRDTKKVLLLSRIHIHICNRLVGPRHQRHREKS